MRLTFPKQVRLSLKVRLSATVESPSELLHPLLLFVLVDEVVLFLAIVELSHYVALLIPLQLAVAQICTRRGVLPKLD